MPKAANPAKKKEERVFYRSLANAESIRAGRADGSGADEEGVYTVRLTTDEPVEVWPGLFEILGHDKGEVRMEWLESKNAPVLWMHDRKQQIGVIEAAEIRDGGIFMTAKLGRGALAKEKRQDIDDDILRNTSVGYRIHEEKLVESSDTHSTWRVTDWEPVEGSFVSLPADPGAGFGRAADKSQLSEAKQAALEQRNSSSSNQPKGNMSKPKSTGDGDNNNTDPVRTVEVVKEPDPKEVQRMADDIANAEIKRREIIEETGTRLELDKDFIERAIREKMSVADFNAAVLKDLNERSKGVTTEEIGLSPKEKKRFSVFNVMDALASNQPERAAFEIEVSDDVKKRQGKDNGRVAIPLDICVRDLVQQRAIRAMAQGRMQVSERALLSVDAVGNQEVANIVDNELLDEMFIESLREDTVFLQRGVTILGGLRGDVTIPIELTNPDMYWVGEDVEPTEGDYTLTTLGLEFKTVAGRVPFTRKAFKQSTPQIENLLTRSMREGVRIALDIAAINGAGTDAVPEGVLNAAGIGSVASGGAISYSHLLSLEEALGNANANTARAIGITNTHGKRLLLETFVNGVGGETALGKRVPGDTNALDTDIGRFYIGNTVPNNLGVGTDKTAMIYGNPAAYFVAMWGGLELDVDLATKVATGGRVVRVFQDVDGRVMQAANFAAIVDLT